MKQILFLLALGFLTACSGVVVEMPMETVTSTNTITFEQGPGEVCDCDITPAKITTYNRFLVPTSFEINVIESTHAPYGMPINASTASNEHLLYQPEYILDYDNDLKVPVWASYTLTAADVTDGISRTECFRKDIRLKNTAAAFCSDYDEPIFDRGHLVPSADMQRSEGSMINTYMFSNMTPQHAYFNRTVWNRLEGHVRNWAVAKGRIHIVTGSIFDYNNNTRRDGDSTVPHIKEDSKVAVPSHFFKIVLHQKNDGSFDSIAFIIPNINDLGNAQGRTTDTYLTFNITTIDAVEKVTGIDFFSALPDVQETTLESATASGLWQ